MIIDAKLKSRFIFPAFGVQVLIFIGATILTVVNDVERTAWLGAAIAALPFPLFVVLLMKRPRPRTSENLPLLLFICSIGVALPLWEQFIEGTSGWPATVTALSAAVLFLSYVFWYSPFGRFESPQLMVGNKLPEFTLTDVDGNAFESASLVGRPAVVLFYRGNWCPFCVSQIDEIAERYQEMDAMGIQVVLVSPQSESHTRELAARYDIPFTALIDKDNKVAESLGIAIKNGVPLGISGDYEPDTVMPTVIVTSPNGTILFSDQTDNYRVRPEPDIFLAILRRAGVKPT